MLGGGPVHAVLFDYGGTLADVRRPVAAIDAAQRAVARCLADAGHAPPAAATLLREVHDRVEEAVTAHESGGALQEIDLAALELRAFADLGLVLTDGLRDRCAAIVQTAWLRGVRLHREVVGVLTDLRAGGLRIGLCSNAPYRPASMHEQLRHVGLDRLLDAAVFSGEVGWRKPSPRLFTAALTMLAAEPATTVFVGDRHHEDVAGAHAMGMRTVLVRRGAAAAGTPPVAPADAVVSSLRPLPGMLIPHPVTR